MKTLRSTLIVLLRILSVSKNRLVVAHNHYLVLWVTLLAGFSCLAQVDNIPLDTSFTIYNNYVKLRKYYPFVTPITPAHSGDFNTDTNVVYKTLGERALHLDVFYTDVSTNVVRPGILLIHGGGWNSGSKEQLVLLGQDLAKHGYVAMTIEYRRSPEAQYPAAVLDLKEAVRWSRAHADTYGIDTSRIIALGCSAGAQLASLIGTTGIKPIFQGPTKLYGYSTSIQAVINVDGILSFIHPEADAEGAAAAQWLGGTRATAWEHWREASPLEYAGAETPPFLFINSAVPRFHAGRDDLIRILEANNIFWQVYTIPDSSHGFWLVHPWYEETLRYVLQFLDEVFEK